MPDAGDPHRRNGVTVLLAEDDEGQAILITRNLKRSGMLHDIIHFADGEQIMNFLWRRGEGPQREPGRKYVALVDIRMPKVDGLEVLRKVKADEVLRVLPVIMVSTNNDPREIERCYYYGCSSYLTKPVDYDLFVEAIVQLGRFLQSVEVPVIGKGE